MDFYFNFLGSDGIAVYMTISRMWIFIRDTFLIYFLLVKEEPSFNSIPRYSNPIKSFNSTELLLRMCRFRLFWFSKSDITVWLFPLNISFCKLGVVIIISCVIEGLQNGLLRLIINLLFITGFLMLSSNKLYPINVIVDFSPCFILTFPLK